MIRTLTAVRYVCPLREGGSLPAVVETDEDGLFVVKFRGAGQGARALVAELVAGRLAAEAGLPVPELALVDVPPPFGRSEPDPEIQDVLRASHGMNVGMRYLDGALNFEEAAAHDLVDPGFAADLVWFDAFVTNPDRTARNPNLLVHRDRLWLIDHGAALYAHHNWERVDEVRTRTPFEAIAGHVLLPRAGELPAADARLCARLTPERVEAVLADVPDVLLLDPLSGGRDFGSAAAARERYRAYLETRLESPRAFVEAAERAREARCAEVPRGRSARR